MTRRAYALFAIMAVAWGIPYFFIKIAVEELTSASMVFARCGLATLFLVPIAWRNGSLRAALSVWRWVLFFAVLEFALPWYLIGLAEQRISSSLAGLLIATVPLFATVIGRVWGDTSATDWRRLVGLAVGFLGVGTLLGLDGLSGQLDWAAVAMTLVAALCYVVAPMTVVRKIPHIPMMGVVTLGMPITTAIWAVPGIRQWPDNDLRLGTWAALVVLAIFATGLAFYYYWQLVDAVGVVRASLITYLNPVVALALGVALFAEEVTRGMLIGFPLVLLGSYFATRPPRSRDEAIVAEV